MVDKTLDKDYSELSETLFGDGNCFNSNEVRKRMYGMKTVIDSIEQDIIPDISEEDLELKKLELKKERQKLYDQRNALNKLIREKAREEELEEIIRLSISAGNLPELDYQPANLSYEPNDLLVSLNDVHYGATVNNFWNQYDSAICKKMMGNYLGNIIDIKSHHKSENCYIWANGDLISGNIHQSIAITNKENVIEQIVGVSELIALFIAELSRWFHNVYFVSVAGNHSRIESKDKALLSERLDDLVEWYLKARLQEFENVSVGYGTKVDPTIYTMYIRGHTYLGVHGDYDGSPAKIQTLQSMAGKDIYAVLSGHLHHNKIDSVQGIKTIMAGSFLGMDDYCVSKRIIGKPEQLICVCNDSGILCLYNALLN